MSFGEAWLLTNELLSDPTSRVASSVAGWAHPWSHEAMILADLYDLQAAKAAGKRRPKPYPRPWVRRQKLRPKPAPGVTQEQILAALREAGHTNL